MYTNRAKNATNRREYVLRIIQQLPGATLRMEKIYVKPICREIVAKSASEDGYCDIFSYEPDSSDDFKKRGSLFVIGHVRHQSEDLAYIVNLVAALAKREYYAKPMLAPKDAFAGVLRKINEVVEEFFRNKELEMNIGIFAIANDQIYISKLGKFKIFLARDGKNIDILNNIELFEKEHVQSKEFCNIISGKIQKSDRLLAFYPGQPVSSRERYIKDDFLKLGEADFATKIDTLKSKSEQFACTLLYVSMQEVTEVPTIPKIAPQELAAAEFASVKKSVKQTETAAETASAGKPEVKSAQKTVHTVAEKEKPAVKTVDSLAPLAEPAEIPQIIPSEFSLGKRRSFFSSFSRNFRFPGIAFDWKNKYLIGTTVVLGLAVLGFAGNMFFFSNPQNRQMSDAVKAAQENIKVAQEKITQNDAFGARNLLLSSLGTIYALPDADESSKVESVLGELSGALNGIDNAKDAAPAPIWQVPQDFGRLELIAAAGTDLYAYATAPEANSGTVFTVANGTSGTPQGLKDMHPRLLLANGQSVVPVDISAGTIAIKKNDALIPLKLDLPQNATDAVMYQDNLYAIAGTAILKFIDAAVGATKAAPWLADGTSAPANSLRIAIDGNIYVLSGDGLVTTFYKGKQINQYQAPFAPDSGTLLATTLDSALMILVNPTANRIYVLDKKSGSLVQTYAVKLPEKIVSASLGPDNVLYFATADNKIWSIK